jgi:hypothetical protein
MRRDAALVTLKLHRVELGIAAALALFFVGWVLLIELRMAMVDVPAGCFESWAAAPGEAGACAGPMRAWGTILGEEGSRVIAAMAFIPFIVGLLGGVPIVAREIETRTAATAWSLNGSRVRWLIRQVLPIVILLGTCVAAHAIATGQLEVDRTIWGYSPVEDLGQYGLALLPRAFGAFGLGLLAGALSGRTLPALALGAVLVISVVFALGLARQAWVERVDPVVVGTSDGGGSLTPGAVVTGVAWRSPDGDQLSITDARARAHQAGIGSPSAADAEDGAAFAWLVDEGYIELSLGITRETALEWARYDGVGFALLGFLSIGATAAVVRTKRPA